MNLYKIGDIIKVKVTGITDYGFFVNVDYNYNGLCHISNIAHGYVSDIKDYVHEYEDIYVEIVNINNKTMQMDVSIKDINYKIDSEEGIIKESRSGFKPLRDMLPIWINEKMEEYKNSQNGN